MKPTIPTATPPASQPSPSRADLSQWLTKHEAAELLQVSGRTIERMAAGREIEQRTRKRPGRKPEPVYSPAAIADLAAARPAIITTPAAPTQALAVRPPRHDDATVAIVELLARALAPMRGGEQRRPWLTIAEAAEYSGITEARLRRMAKHGRVRSLRDRGVKIWRQDLDHPDAVADSVEIVTTAKGAKR